MISSRNVYYGGYGLMTYQGIPKAAYLAYQLLGQLAGIALEDGPGYIVTRSENHNKIHIMLYHYSHYDQDRHLRSVLPEDEQRTYDRYYGFDEQGMLNFRFYLYGVKEGIYEKETYTVNRKYGSSYDIWMNMGAPEILTEKQRIYIEKQSVPGYQYEMLRVNETGELLVSAALSVHEIRLICITKK